MKRITSDFVIKINVDDNDNNNNDKGKISCDIFCGTS